MSAEFLLEIGTEELPSSFVRHALASMERSAQRLVKDARLGSEACVIQPLGTARRLALSVKGLRVSQPDRNDTVVGPPWKAAFDEDGSPKKSAVGFARKHGVEVSVLRKQSTDKGEYVSVDVHEVGRATLPVLEELLPELCREIAFPKSMRWGSGDVAFGRPIHWIVALLGNEIVPFEFAGIPSGRTTRGHRFLAPKTFELPEAGAYVASLAAAHVLVDLDARKERMVTDLDRSAKDLGGVLEPDAFLADECVSLVEEPFVVPGQFDAAFLELPEDVVIAVMRDHQRYFAVRRAPGEALLPAYLNVVNTAEDPATISKGNDRVLRARLADARFFVEEDRKAPLVSRLDKLESVVFQSKLGTMGQKVRRIERLARSLAPAAGVDSEAASEAARLSKADLETLIVYEFPELQGEMGRWYAHQEGISSEVADAIADHYRPQGADDVVPHHVLGAVVAVADRFDTLVGCFGIGLVPSGSADPFALRRAALGIIRIALEGPMDVDVRTAIDQAYEAYADDAKLAPAIETRDTLEQFFRGRIRALAKERYAADVVDACLGAWEVGSIRDLDARMGAVAEVRAAPEFDALAVAFKRAFNITKESARGAIDRALLEPGAEQALAAGFDTARDGIRAAIEERRYADALRTVATELGAPIDRFFEEVFVMVDDPKVRENRLRLLGEIADTVNGVAHFHQLATRSERRDPAVPA